MYEICMDSFSVMCRSLFLRKVTNHKRWLFFSRFEDLVKKSW